ncbi:MAG: hypothetical protein HRU80_02805 [Ignavibacteriales bacterium]|nr:MAG: hypothetical protein HRU80_02805 [Ignavibacteriales bacterium]
MIQAEYGFPIASFGVYLKYYCVKNGLPTDRKALQDTGEAFVKESPKRFLSDVLSHFIGFSNIIVLEGVRHRSILEEVYQLTENHLTIFAEADFETRFKRYYSRNKDTDEVKTLEYFKEADNHPVEHDIAFLKFLCNLSVDSTSDKDISPELFTFLSHKLKR